MELKEIVSLYRRWSWLLVGGLVLGLACGLLASVVQTRVYQASTKVLVARNRQQGNADILAISDQQLVATYQQLLKTKPVLDEAGTKLGVKVNADNVEVALLPNTQIIQITVSDQDASRAAGIANALAQVLISENETLQLGRYATYEQGLNSQISQIQTQISDLQGQISKLDQANIQEQLGQVNKQISSLKDEILTLEKEIAQSSNPASPIERATLTAQQAQLSQLQSLLALYQEIQTNLTYIGKPIQAGTIAGDPQITGLQSTLNLYQQLYLNLLNNLEAVKLARVQSTPTVTQIETAATPKKPVRPQPLLYTGLAGMVGLILAAGAILLIEYFDDTFNTPQKAQELLHAPVIGQIAETGSGNRKWYLPPVRTAHGQPPSGNAFGSLRINLSRILARKSRNTVLITSTGRGEGKTTVAASLARSLAQSGKRVIVVDAYIAHPQIHTQFGLDNHMGLTDILAGGVDWQEVSCTEDKVTIITSGTSSGNAGGLLESEKMTDLLERLQRKADIVIVDGPPLFMLEGQVLASKLGGLVLVIQQGETRTSIAHSVKDQLELMEADLLGVVMNRVPVSTAYYSGTVVGKGSTEKVEDKAPEAEAA